LSKGDNFDEITGRVAYESGELSAKPSSGRRASRRGCIVGFFFALALGIYLALSILRSGRD